MGILRNFRYREYVCDQCPNRGCCDRLSLELQAMVFDNASRASRIRLEKKLKSFHFMYPSGRKFCTLADWEPNAIDSLIVNEGYDVGGIENEVY